MIRYLVSVFTNTNFLQDFYEIVTKLDDELQK